MILIIDKSKKNANDLANMLYYMGILATARTPSEALSEISTAYRAVVISNPDMLADKVDYIKRLRSYASGIPTFAISPSKDECDMAIFDEVFPSGMYGAKLLSRIFEYAEEFNLKPPGVYRLCGIDCS